MDAQHTPESYTAYGRAVFSGEIKICETEHHDDIAAYQESCAIAHRIAAALNACAEAPTAHLEKIGTGAIVFYGEKIKEMALLRSDLDTLRQQKEELTNLLKDVLFAIDANQNLPKQIADFAPTIADRLLEFGEPPSKRAQPNTAAPAAIVLPDWENMEPRSPALQKTQAEPELLNACKDLLKEVEEYHGADCNHQDCKVMQKITAARVAIAKVYAGSWTDIIRRSDFSEIRKPEETITGQINRFIKEHSGNTGDPLRDTRDALNIALDRLEHASQLIELCDYAKYMIDRLYPNEPVLKGISKSIAEHIQPSIHHT